MNVKKIVFSIFLISIILLTSCQSQQVPDDLRGNVINFNEEYMEIEVMMITILDDGSWMGVTGTHENETMDIYFTEETIFEIHEMTPIENGDIEVEVSPGKVNDLGRGGSVTIFGEGRKNDFTANKIEIWVFAN